MGSKMNDRLEILINCHTHAMPALFQAYSFAKSANEGVSGTAVMPVKAIIFSQAP